MTDCGAGKVGRNHRQRFERVDIQQHILSVQQKRAETTGRTTTHRS